jgi:hypothetical protein
MWCNQQTIACLILMSKPENPPPPWFWGSTKKHTTNFEAKLGETVTTGFKAKPEKIVVTNFEVKSEKIVPVILMPN